MEISHVQVEAFEGKLKEMEAGVELLHQQLDDKRRELKDARSKAEEHQETAAIFKLRYTAAIEKARRTCGQLERLQEELQYSQQQVTQYFIRISLKRRRGSGTSRRSANGKMHRRPWTSWRMSWRPVGTC